MRKFIIMFVLASSVAHGEPQTTAVFPGNEAVSNVGGKRVVKMMSPSPPKWPSPAYFAKPSELAMKSSNPRFGSFGSLYMIEGPNELLECSEPVVSASICRPSTIGQKKKLARQWIVLLSGTWTMCHKPEGEEKPLHGGYYCMTDAPPNRLFVKLMKDE